MYSLTHVLKVSIHNAQMTEPPPTDTVYNSVEDADSVIISHCRDFGFVTQRSRLESSNGIVESA